MVKCEVSAKRDLRVMVSEKKTTRPRSYRLLSPLHSNEFKRSSPQLSGRAAPEAAKKKKTAKQASLQSEIIICGGQGRETWECCKLINYGVPCWTLPLMDTNCGGLSWKSTSTDSIKHIKGTNSTLIFPGFFYCSVQINHI